MSREDMIYLLLLLSSIPLGHLVKSLKSSSKRQFVSFVGGLTLVMLTAGIEGAWHSAITILGNYLIVRIVGPRLCHLASFIFVFGYLFFFRTCTWFGFAKPPTHCNAIQLLVTLRMVGLAFEIHQRSKDSNSSKDDISTVEQHTDSFLLNHPSLYDYYSYGYCYCGLMTGPYYSYRTFHDMLNQDSSKISTIIPALRALKYLPFFSVPYLILHHFFPLKHIGSDEYLEHRWGSLYRLLYLVPCFTWFRIRFYIGWMLAKCMCVTMALGAYPFESEPKPGKGPTKVIEPDQVVGPARDGTSDTHSFETIHNIDIFDVELSCSVKKAMIAWNKTVQWWLFSYVHRQIPFKAFRMTIVLLVSAFWHGVHPGYYVTFMSVPLLALADTRMRKAVTPYLNAKQMYVYDWLNWFCLYRSFEYLGVGFMMLKLDIVWKVYKKLYFVGHFILLICVLIPCFIPKKPAFMDSEEKRHAKVD